MLIQIMAGHKHLIKKYANRKLYDTHTSRYITLEGISQLVREGHDIQVVERDSGRDLTALVLSQIVVGEEKRGPHEGDAGPDQPHERARTPTSTLGSVPRSRNVASLIEPSRLARRRPSGVTASGTWPNAGGGKPRAR